MAAKVSFVVAVYKVSEYIEQCVRSLYGQTLDDIEILLVDDCTPDDSIDIALRVLEEYPHRKGQVRTIHHERNMDLPQTRWDGIKAVTGEFVILIDGDDYVDERMAEMLYNKAVETGADMVVSDHWMCTPEGNVERKMAPNGAIGDGDNIRTDIINLKVPVNVWCKLVRRSVYTENDIVWPVKGYGEDVVVSTVTAYYAKRIACVEEPLYYYRYNPKSYSRGYDVETRVRLFEDYKKNQDVLIRFMSREGLLEKYEQGMFVGKVKVKRMLLPLVSQRKYRRLYFGAYPEVDRAFVFGNSHRRPCYRERVWVAAIWLGLYSKMERRLYSKRFRPRLDWLP